MTDLTARDVDKLHVQSGDILILRIPKLTDSDALVAYQKVAEKIRNHFYATDIDDVLILVLGPGSDLSTVDDQTMAGAGWTKTAETC